MARKPESNFTSSLRTGTKAWEGLEPRIFCVKFNILYGPTVVDCWYSGSRSDLWTEHKFFKALPRMIDLTKLNITTSLQQGWLVDRYEEGRNVGMIVGSPQGCLYLPGLTWQTPMRREEFLSRCMPKPQLVELLVDLLGARNGRIPSIRPTRGPSNKRPRRGSSNLH